MQTFLTIAIDATVLLGLSGIIAHYFLHFGKTKEILEIPPTPQIEPKQEKIQIKTPPEKPEKTKDFSKLTLKELTEICKADKEKYKGYTTITKKGGKSALAKWMENKE